MANGKLISSNSPRAGDIVDAFVLQVNRDAALVDICYKQDIAIPKSRLAFPEPESAADIVAAGDVIIRAVRPLALGECNENFLL